jgi:MFS family permease
MAVVDRPAVRGCRPLVGLLVAHGVSLTGNVLTLIALPLYVLAQTGSPALTGVTGAVATLPVILGGALGGVFVDRLGYRRTSVVADLIGAVTIGAVPLLDQTVGLPLWALLALVFATGLLDTPGQVARNALLPEAAALAGVPLERAVGWFEAIERGARLAGAPLAGLLVAVVGAPGTMALDAATFLAAALTVLWLLPAAPRIATGALYDPERESDPADAAPAPRTGYWRELADGVRFLLREPLLRAVILLVLCTNVLDAAKSSVLLPVAAQRQLGGPIAYGLLVGTMAGGALAGSLLFSAVGHRLPRRATFVTAFTLAGAPPLLALALDLPLPVLVAITATAGLAAGAINPIISTLKLERVPPGMRARVYGVMGAGTWAGMPLGSLAAGLATEHIGLTATLTTAGATYLLLTLTPLLGGPWKHMSAPQSSPGSDRCAV